jgi:hypothetical protein
MGGVSPVLYRPVVPAVQIQLQYSQAPEWRTSSILAESPEIAIILQWGVCVGGGESPFS